MQLLINLINRFGLFFLFIFLELISLLLIMQNRNFHKSVAGEVNTGVSGALYNYSGKVNTFLYSPKEVENLQKENSFLREQLFIKQHINKEIKTSSYEKFDTLKTGALQNYQVLPAKVINNSIAKNENYITINRGKKHGVEKDMGVITSRGVAGVIINVSDHYAKATSLLNPNQPLNARIKNMEYFGTLRWRGNKKNPRYLYLEEIPKYVKVKIGDTIETDGKSYTFPEGIALGRVNKVGIDKENGYLELEVKIFQDFANLQSAYVIKNLQKKELDTLERTKEEVSEK